MGGGGVGVVGGGGGEGRGGGGGGGGVSVNNAPHLTQNHEPPLYRMREGTNTCAHTYCHVSESAQVPSEIRFQVKKNLFGASKGSGQNIKEHHAHSSF